MNKIIAIPLLIVLFPISNFVSAWGNGNENVFGYEHYGVHDVIADCAYLKLKEYNETIARWITDWYIPNSGNKGPSFNPSNEEPTNDDNWLAYTDDPDTVIEDNLPNHVYFVHLNENLDRYGSITNHMGIVLTRDMLNGYPNRVKELYDETIYHLTAWLNEEGKSRSLEQHKAAYSAGLLAHYIGDTTNYAHTDYTKKELTLYHRNYEHYWSAEAIEKLKDFLLSSSFRIERINDIRALAIEQAKYVNSHDGKAVEYEDIDGTLFIVGSTYAYMLDKFSTQYEAGLYYNGIRGYDGDLWFLTLEHISIAVENFLNILYSAYITAFENSDKGVMTLQLGIPFSNIFNGKKIEHTYIIKSYTYSGENPLVILLKTNYDDDIKKINARVYINDEEIAVENNNGIMVVQPEIIKGRKAVKIFLYLKDFTSLLGYSIGAYAEFEKVDESKIEQIPWSDNIGKKEGFLEKMNEEKYYWISLPANKRLNIKLNYIGTNNETDFDLYVGLAQPNGIGIPRIYQFDYRGFTIDANETVPMKGSVGPFEKEAKVYILVRAYMGSGKFILYFR
ncbi:MAG: hypothetical protein AB1779_11115 [Candidatus Thermoplasmatota archaeon]